MQFTGIIPARYASTRFPGKPLVTIRGVSMIRRVYEQALKATSLSHVMVATDDQRIFDHVSSFGKVVMTSPHHPSGTDRCFEAATRLQDELKISASDVIVNIQGDEPFVQPEQIEELCRCFERKEVSLATLIKKISENEDVFNENIVKVVSDQQGRALYFSRSPIPFLRGAKKDDYLKNHAYFRHIGMYAYKMKVLEQITKLAPSSLEQAESLEQLRWLQNGFDLHVRETFFDSQGIDTPGDLESYQQ